MKAENHQNIFEYITQKLRKRHTCEGIMRRAKEFFNIESLKIKNIDVEEV